MVPVRDSSPPHQLSRLTEASTLAEATLGKWFESTKRRKDIFLATKFGAHDPTGSHEKSVLNCSAYHTEGADTSTEEQYPNHRMFARPSNARFPS